MRCSGIVVVVAGAIIASAYASDAHAQSRIDVQQMDRDNDGVVTRAEWRGTSGAFRQLDVNRDGILSGTEIWSGSDDTRQSGGRANRNNDEGGSLDDGNGAFVSSQQRFRELDLNQDGAITRREWNGTYASYRALDRNHDNRVTRDEFRRKTSADDAFDRSDVGRNRDRNVVGGGRNTPFSGATAATSRNTTDTRSNAYRVGYQRGQIEGRSAGREDKVRNQGWDLEGQRELETADSGYDARMGSKPEYQNGYRDGFRSAYRDGWDHP
jgi:EF hand